MTVHMAVSKKFLPRAVDRNRVRRLIREAARLRELPGTLVLVRLMRKPTAAFAQPDSACKRLVRAELDDGFARLVQRLAATD